MASSGAVLADADTRHVVRERWVGFAPKRSLRIAGGLVLVHVAIAIAIVLRHPVHAVGDDIARFFIIASAPGTPYRDFQVEYAPLELLLIRSVLHASLSDVVGRVATLSLLSDIGIFLVLRWGWGLRSSIAYLALSIPLQVFMPFRLDLVVVFLTVLSFGLAFHGRERAGGVVFALAVLWKLWPLVLLPVFLIDGRVRAAIWGVALSAAGMVAWVFFAGVGAVHYVLSFRDAKGWQVESSVGAVLAVLREPMRPERGAIRIGSIPAWAPIVLGVLTLAVLIMVWRKAWHAPVLPEGFPALAAIATLIAGSRVASPQYIAWFIPFAAIAITEIRRPVLAFVAGTTSVLAAAVFLEYWGIVGGEFELAWLAFARAFAVVTIPILWLAGGDSVGSHNLNTAGLEIEPRGSPGDDR